MPTDFDLTMAEIRAVAEYALAAARSVSGLLDDHHPRTAPRLPVEFDTGDSDGGDRVIDDLLRPR